MTSKTAKKVRSLHQKKYRLQENLFLVEGAKSVVELLDSNFQVEMLFYTEKFENQYDTILKKVPFSVISEKISAPQLAKISTFKTNEMALAVVQIPENKPLKMGDELVLALADIRDPGNLGTIIRIADWYGISKIVCSKTSVDWYNPKVISGSMGSFLRLKPFYTDLENFFAQSQKASIPIFGTFLEGENIHETKAISKGVLVIGNESKGIPPSLEKWISHRLTIPKFGNAESLNAGIATAIICDNFRRKRNEKLA